MVRRKKFTPMSADPFADLDSAMADTSSIIPGEEEFVGLQTDGYVLDLDLLQAFLVTDYSFTQHFVANQSLAKIQFISADLVLSGDRITKVQEGAGVPSTMQITNDVWQKRYMPVDQWMTPRLASQKNVVEDFKNRFAGKLEAKRERERLLKFQDKPQDFGSW